MDGEYREEPCIVMDDYGSHGMQVKLTSVGSYGHIVMVNKNILEEIL